MAKVSLEKDRLVSAGRRRTKGAGKLVQLVTPTSTKGALMMNSRIHPAMPLHRPAIPYPSD